MSGLTEAEELELLELENENAAATSSDQPAPAAKPAGLKEAFFPTASVPEPDSATVRVPKRIPGTMAFDPLNQEEKRVPVSPAEKAGRTAVKGFFDLLQAPTRAAGSAAAQLPEPIRVTSATGGEKGFLEGMADPETGVLRAAREWLGKMVSERMADATDEERAYASKVGHALLGELAAAGYLATSALEDPATAISAGAASVAKIPGKVAKIAPAVRTVVAKEAGNLPEDALRHGAKLTNAEIEAAAGTEGEIAERVQKAIKYPGQMEVQRPLLNQAEAIEGSAPASVKARIDTPSPNAADAGKVLKDTDTGKPMKYPMEILREKGTLKKGTTEEKALAAKVKEQYDNLQDLVNKKKVIQVKDALDLKKRLQSIVEASYGMDAPAYKQIIKATAAATRVSVEEAVTGHVSKEYVPLMRKIRDNYQKFGEAEDVFTDDVMTTAAKLVGTRKDTPEVYKALENLDGMLREAGIETNLAEEARRARTAKRLGVQPGGKLAGVNISHTGKSVKGLLTGALLGSALGPKGMALGAFYGLSVGSPKGALRTYRMLEWAEKAAADPKAASKLQTILSTRNAAVIARVGAELDAMTLPANAIPFPALPKAAEAEREEDGALAGDPEKPLRR